MTKEIWRPQRATDLEGVHWFKSSYSGGGESQCVEAADLTKTPYNAMALRDSKAPTGPVLIITTGAFSAFVAAAGGGRFDG
ncbi:DUF397 domain-containing protein [Streptomyces sp. NPDC002586]